MNEQWQILIWYKKDLWEQIISLEIDSETQKELLNNSGLVSAISPVFQAIWNIQDQINNRLKKESNKE